MTQTALASPQLPCLGVGELPPADEAAEAARSARAYICLPCGVSATVADDHVFVAHQVLCMRHPLGAIVGTPDWDTE